MQLLVFLRADLWDGMTVGILVGSASLAWPQLSSTELFRQSLLGSTARTDVETTILMAYAQISSPSLQTQDKLRFLHSIAQAYDTLHLPRKKAVILRQLALVSSTEVAQEENKPVEMDLATDAGDFRGATIVKSGSQASGAADVLDMLRRAYQIYALPNPFEEESLRASFVPPEELALVFERIFAHYGWLELQHALVKEAVRVCELLPGKLVPLPFEGNTPLTALLSQTWLELRGTLPWL